MFQTLDTDLGLEESSTAKRVCIATPEIPGPTKKVGIGLTYHYLALFLVEQGHEVDIVYVNNDAKNRKVMAELHEFYTGVNIGFYSITPHPASKAALAEVSAPTWALLEWLRQERPFDILHVPEWSGLGYGSLLTKSLGIAFSNTHFVVHCHGPTLWTTESNRKMLSSEHQLGWVFMERNSVELADTVICCNFFLFQWMYKSGYIMPARSFVWPHPFPTTDLSENVAIRDNVPIEEIIFFGRLELCKELLLFTDAISRLAHQGSVPECITFLGNPSSDINSTELVEHLTGGWPTKVNIHLDPELEELIVYLSQPGRIAVIPSLLEYSSTLIMQCLQAGIPFLATAIAGTPELVAVEDHEHALFKPDYIELSERIRQVMQKPIHAVRPRKDFENSLDIWSRWHMQTESFEVTASEFSEKLVTANEEHPLVTVCIVHHERPDLLVMAVNSVFAQTYPNIEAVLVDDGSTSIEALAALDTLQSEFEKRGWSLIRQENRYLGAARNAAVAVARGEWLLFLDDDNVLFEDAIMRSVRAARFSGSDCVPLASIRFWGDGCPLTNAESHGTPIRFLGAARGWCHFRNVVGDSCALVSHKAFQAVGGFTDEYRVGLDDLSLFNSLIHAGYQIRPIPDPAYFYRIGTRSMKSRNRSAETGQFRVISPYLQGLADEERAFTAYATSCIHGKGWPKTGLYLLIKKVFIALFPNKRV